MPIDRDIGWLLTPSEAQSLGRKLPDHQRVNLANERGQVVELAAPNSSLRGTGSPGMPFPQPGNPYGSYTGQGRVRMVPADDLPNRAPMGELGTAWPRERLYAYFDGGTIFSQGPIFAERYDDMMRQDGKVKAISEALSLPVMALSWHLEKGKNDKGEFEFINEAMTATPEEGGMSVPLDRVIAQMTGGFFHRRAHFEKVFKIRDDGRVVYDRLAWRDPTTCYLGRLATTAQFAGIMQWAWKGFTFEKILIPAAKSLVYIHGQHRNPLQGVSDLETAYHLWDAKQKIRFLWYAFLENFSMPKAWVTEPTGDERKTKELVNKVAQLKGGGVVGLSENQVVHPYESSQHAPGEFQAAISYLDSQISGSVLAGFLDLTQAAATTGRGSHALSRDNSQFFKEASQARANEISATITSDVLRDLAVYNFGPGASVPRFTFGSIAAGDAVDASISMMQTLMGVPERFPGAVPLVPDEFVDLLTERVAGYLDLDVDAVHKALLRQGHKPRPFPAGMTPEQAQAIGAVSTATRMVAQAQPQPQPGPNGRGMQGPGPGVFYDTASYRGEAGAYPG